MTETNPHRGQSHEHTNPPDAGIGLTLSNHGTLADQSQHHRPTPDPGKPGPESNPAKIGKIEVDQPIPQGDYLMGKHHQEANPGSAVHPSSGQHTNPMSQTQSNGDRPIPEAKSQATEPQMQSENPSPAPLQPPPQAEPSRPVVRKHTYYTWEMKLAADGDERLDAVSSRKFKEHIIQNFQNLQEVLQARSSEQPLAVPFKPVLPNHLGSDLLTQTSPSSC